MIEYSVTFKLAAPEADHDTLQSAFDAVVDSLSGATDEIPSSLDFRTTIQRQRFAPGGYTQ